ncbi:hypothetical protein BJP36_43585 [Moorena producens JHB]|uniref:Uncharacterized protein n=1 Tax=Moorena producens (strain JHB) TaxID=1454205 RepID=A0A9Q9UVW1_MOOP1|nr:hypothetical protein [Moorena producens]WAN69246.1 hypothetical protein BJP36_43585 [Moorena producens JHB]
MVIAILPFPFPSFPIINQPNAYKVHSNFIAPTPDSRLPTPYSLLPTPYSLFPIPCSLFTLLV